MLLLSRIVLGMRKAWTCALVAVANCCLMADSCSGSDTVIEPTPIVASPAATPTRLRPSYQRPRLRLPPQRHYP